MVDALNEGNGKAFWKDSLAGFLHDVGKSPFVGLVTAVRDTYLHIVVPDAIQKSDILVKVNHEGFGGNELSAVKHFCRYFKLEQPRFPILSPEFANPQLLLLLCRSLRDSGKTSFPEGLNGITEIYKDYLGSINRKIASTLDYPEKAKLAQNCLNRLAEAMSEKGTGAMEYIPAMQVFKDFNSDYGSGLFKELLREGTLHEDRSWDYEKKKSVDVVRFNYERFGDSIAAQYLLEKYIEPKKPKAAFQRKGFFADYFTGYYYDKLGILEALAVILPEKYGAELLEVFPSVRLNDEQFGRETATTFINSLLWRRVDSIDREKIRKYCGPWIERYHLNNYFNSVLLHLAVIPGHPYNADLIHNYLIKESMAELDYHWSPSIYEAYQMEESAIHRLLAWVWSDFDLFSINEESRRLTATILSWLLTSSNNKLRDTATLGLVRLLSGHPDTMTTILQKFKKVKDLYVRERLFAVALGVATNSGEHAGIAKLAQCVYDQIFKDGKPPTHILLRDYARSVVEFAINKQLKVKANVEKIRPPYGSKLPLPYPTEEDIEPYKTDYESKEFKKNESINRTQGAIEHSVLRWDFNRYVIGSKMGQFHSVALALYKEYQEFKKNLPYGTKGKFKYLEKVCKYIDPPYRGSLSEKEFAEFKKMTAEFFDLLVNSIESKLSTELKEIFRNKILYHLQTLNRAKKTGRQSTIEPQPIARWIFRRVFDLGWRKDWHGEFDHLAKDYSHRSDIGTERIGKKYQWIALHEILAMIADNHNVSSWGDKPEAYQGTWEPFVRNIDPTYPYLHLNSEFSNPVQAETWWQPPVYDKWELGDWLHQTEDLPDPRSIVHVKDPNGQSWLNLHSFPDWKKKDEFGIHEWDSTSWVIWYHLRAFFIKRKDAKQIHEWLLKQHFMNEWMPSQKEHYQMFDKEHYWSPAYRYFKAGEKKSSYEGNNLWRKFGESPFKGIVPIEEYGAGGGSYKSQGGHIIKPSEYLWRNMNLRQGKKTGECMNANGELVCFDPSVDTDKPYGFLIQKDFLMDFLQKKRLSLCWTLLGEKQILRKPMSGFSISEFSGAYQLMPNGTIEGGLRFIEEHDMDE
jgi:hypothetical protein